VGKLDGAAIRVIQVIGRLPGIRPEPADILIEIRRQANVQLDSIRQIQEGFVALEQLDAIANRYLTQHTALAAGSGLLSFAGAAGVTGSLTGLIYATIGLAHRLALVYGYDDAVEPGSENLILKGLGIAIGIDLLATPLLAGVGAGVAGKLACLGSATSQAAATAAARALALKQLERALAPALARELIAKGVARTAGQLIPLFGAVIGGVSNAGFLRLWGKRMMEFYRRQHLAARGRSSQIAALTEGSPTTQ
jgi:hypothetical protein